MCISITYMYLLPKVSPMNILYIFILFLFGCSNDNVSNDIVNPGIIPKEEEISRLNLDNKFSPLDSPDQLKSKYNFGKSDPFNDSPTQNKVLIPNDFILKHLLMKITNMLLSTIEAILLK